LVQHIHRFRSQHVRQTARHARTEIQTKRSENNGNAAGHVLATVLANTFDNRKSAAIANSKPFTRAASHEQASRSCTVEHGVTHKHVAATRSALPSRNGNCAARKALADVVVGFAVQFERHSFANKCAETLACGTDKFVP